MGVIKIELTKDLCHLIANIRFNKEPFIETNDKREKINYYIDMNNIYGGNFVLEDISYLLGIYDKHIPGTEEDALGPSFPEELEKYMYDMHLYIINNLQNIEEIVHQFSIKGGIKPGIYTCKDYQHLWKRKD